ncbi:MAG TPA: lipoprotein [Cellvibrio sp.]
MKFPAVLLLLCLGISCLGLSACGQKGPLFLPSEQPEQGSGDKPDASTNEPAVDKTQKPAGAP